MREGRNEADFIKRQFSQISLFCYFHYTRSYGIDISIELCSQITPKNLPSFATMHTTLTLKEFELGNLRIEDHCRLVAFLIQQSILP